MKKCPIPKKAQWISFAVFLFFLVKGLIWLAILAISWLTFG